MTESASHDGKRDKKVVFNFQVTKTQVIAFIALILLGLGAYGFYRVGQRRGKLEQSQQEIKQADALSKLAPLSGQQTPNLNGSVKTPVAGRTIITGMISGVNDRSFTITDKNNKQEHASIDDESVVLNSKGQKVSYKDIQNKQKVTVIANLLSDNTLGVVQLYIN